MDILVLGGTVYLGRHMVDAALARGHRVTLFNRGRSQPNLYPEVEKLVGDRDGDLSALQGRKWDAVIDTSGYVPRIVRRTAEALQGNIGHYVFVSSVSVYDDFRPDQDEDSATPATMPDETSEDIGRYYGALKRRCEQVLDDLFPSRALHIRAGFIVGAYDTNNRFPYWVRRVARGGDVLAPGHPDDPVQIIDARDLADWAVRKAEDGTAGPFNVTGPATPLRFETMLDAIRSAVGGDARWVWVDSDFLSANQIAPMDGIPFWIPAAYRGFVTRRIDRALQHGLTFRPLEETVKPIWDWLQNVPERTQSTGVVTINSGISAAREAELLAAWQESRNKA